MATAETDLYAVLGLTPQATRSEITRAYRALLRQHHPDTRHAEQGRSGVAADAVLQAVLTAYDVLHDPTRRAAYDSRRDHFATRTAREHVRVHRTPTAATTTPPIQVGPVRWHHQPGP